MKIVATIALDGEIVEEFGLDDVDELTKALSLGIRHAFAFAFRTKYGITGRMSGSMLVEYERQLAGLINHIILECKP